MLTNSDITVVCAVDNPYAMMVTTMIKSLEQSHESNEKIHVFIIDNGLTKISRWKLKQSINSSKIQLVWLSVNEESLKLLNLNNYYKSLTTHYYRLLIPYLLPDKFSKVIYLDSDLLILKDLNDLWHKRFDDNIVLAVQDSRIRYVSSSWGGINNYKEMGLSSKSKFFNTGVLLIDLKKWKAEKISEKVIKCNEENKKYVKYWDQYGLNVVLSEKWGELDPCWNQFPEITGVDPFILHYVGKKPIDTDYDGEYKDLFLKYLGMTKWRLYEQGPFIKIGKKIISSLPFLN
jgi:lipopolysaccharide biosynthesis glycosyltransferase|tara:strand:- start:356 stop:1222 length:867 start_codon:yes stop_codon:yes gene_type:complete